MTEEVKLYDKWFELYISHADIQERVRALAEAINADYRESTPIFVSVLNGALFFTADLVRLFDAKCEVDFVKVASYQGTTSTGKVKQIFGLSGELKNRHVIILEDIVDTGITINKLIKDLECYNPSTIHVAALTLKREALQEPVKIDYLGFEVPDQFIVGYGLDYDQLGRNLQGIYKLKDR